MLRRIAASGAAVAGGAAVAYTLSKTTEEQRRERSLFSALQTVYAEDLGTFLSKAATAGGAAVANALMKTTEGRGLFSTLQTVYAEDLGTFLSKARYDGPLPPVIAHCRFDTLMPQPPNPKYKLAVIEFDVPDEVNGGADKGPDGHRIDSIPICNGVIKTGNSCELLKYFDTKHDDFAKQVKKYDALIVRINPGQLSTKTLPGTQERFDGLMNDLLKQGKLVWSAPEVQHRMGAKDALVAINGLACALPDTFAYSSAEEMEAGFKKTAAFQPRVIKQNLGTGGEGIWLVWPRKDLCANFGDAALEDHDMLKLVEMSDNHVEHHTVKEFIAFCADGPSAEAGEWKSTYPGGYFAGGKAAGGQVVDQRLLPRIVEGEVRMLMVGDQLQMIIHNKPAAGGLSTTGGAQASQTFFRPGGREFAELERRFIGHDLPQLKKALGIENEPLPLLWTADFIPKDGSTPGTTEYVISEFNCSCVNIAKLQAVSGTGTKTLADVPDADYYEACQLTDLMGSKAVQMLDQSRML